MSGLLKLKNILKKSADPKQAENLSWFFKTGPGEYGEGDKFLGIKVPTLRKIAKNFLSLDLEDIQILLDSRIHEHRAVALFILEKKYRSVSSLSLRAKCGNPLFDSQKEIIDFYLKNTSRINNWDLVDLSAPKILGDYLLNRSRVVLYKLARSKNLWERRIAILATFAFIRADEFADTIKIAEIFLNDKHDLIHKAAGWALREVGKKNLAVEEKFLRQYGQKMPRTMLRYAIEKFDERKKRRYLLKA